MRIFVSELRRIVPSIRRTLLFLLFNLLSICSCRHAVHSIKFKAIHMAENSNNYIQNRNQKIQPEMELLAIHTNGAFSNEQSWLCQNISFWMLNADTFGINFNRKKFVIRTEYEWFLSATQASSFLFIEFVSTRKFPPTKTLYFRKKTVCFWRETQP